MRERRSNHATKSAVFFRRPRSTLVAEGGDEPGPCVSPVGVGRSGRDAEGGRGLRDGQAGEVAELDHFRDPGLDGREPVERLVEGQQTWGRARGRRVGRGRGRGGSSRRRVPARACDERIRSGCGAWPQRQRRRSARGHPSDARQFVRPAEGMPHEPERWAGGCARGTRRPCAAAASFRSSSYTSGSRSAAALRSPAAAASSR